MENLARPFVYEGERLVCGGVGLVELAEEFGTPLYVYSGDQIAERAGMLQAAFGTSRGAGVESTVCYAVKANSSLALIQLLGQAGAGFDIVSGGELERVKKAAKKALRDPPS